MVRHGWVGLVLLGAAILSPTARAADNQPGAQRFAVLETGILDSTSLGPVARGVKRTMEAVPDGVPVASGLVHQAGAHGLRPAPLPDQDLDAPGPDHDTLAAQEQASVQPSFYSNTRHFSGDGFAPGSVLEDDKNNRRRPGGGMSLSIPMP